MLNRLLVVAMRLHSFLTFGVANGGAAGCPFRNEKSVLFDASNQLNESPSFISNCIRVSVINWFGSFLLFCLDFLSVWYFSCKQPSNILHHFSANYRSFNLSITWRLRRSIFWKNLQFVEWGYALSRVPLHLDPKANHLQSNFLKKQDL